MTRNSKRISITQLKGHINRLSKKHGFKIKHGWGRYDGPNNTVYFPAIRSATDYIVALHEVGHALTKHITDTALRIRTVKQLLGNLERQLHSPGLTPEKLKGLKIKMHMAIREVHRLHKLTGAVKWILNNETIAWKYAFENAIVWTDECYKKVIDSMLSYWLACVNKPKLSVERQMASYEKFHEKYVSPIFSLNK